MEPWNENPDIWQAFVAYQSMENEVSTLRRVYTNPPSWSSIRQQYHIFKEGYMAGKLSMYAE